MSQALHWVFVPHVLLSESREDTEKPWVRGG